MKIFEHFGYFGQNKKSKEGHCLAFNGNIKHYDKYASKVDEYLFKSQVLPNLIELTEDATLYFFDCDEWKDEFKGEEDCATNLNDEDFLYKNIVKN